MLTPSRKIAWLPEESGWLRRNTMRARKPGELESGEILKDEKTEAITARLIHYASQSIPDTGGNISTVL